MGSQAKRARWFSENPGKAWGEKFFLIYSLVWTALMGLSIVTKLYETMNNTGMLISGAVISFPLVLFPLLFHKVKGHKWYETYWFKANLFIFILSFFQNYFLTHYFFDVLGMVYLYPNVTSHLEAALVGVSRQTVPLIMYFYTQCFYMTYHATAIVALRRVTTSRLGRFRLTRPMLFLLASLFWAFMETFIMSKASGFSFWYRDVGRMMKYGSFIYAYSFISSFLFYFAMDEKADKKWGVGKVALCAFASNAITLLLFDVTTHFIGSI